MSTREYSTRLINPFHQGGIIPGDRSFEFANVCIPATTFNGGTDMQQFFLLFIESVVSNQKLLRCVLSAPPIEVRKSKVIGPEIFQVFPKLDGSICFPIPEQDNDLLSFFSKGNRLFREGDRYFNRGADFYAGIDPSLSVEIKINRIVETIFEALEIVEKKSVCFEELTRDESVAFLAMLDYLKSYSLILFHAISYQERFGDFGENDACYGMFRQQLATLALESTRVYYRTLVGLPFEKIDFSSHKEELISYLLRQATNNQYFTFKMPEVDHPLTFLGSAYLQLIRHPDIESIIVIPSGGTEFALATRVAFEVMQERKVPLVFLPVSTHSAKLDVDRALDTQQRIISSVLQKRSADIVGKKVLVLDDNTNTGTTLDLVTAGAVKWGAARVDVATSQADIHRMAIKHSRWCESQRPSTLPSPATAGDAVTFTPITRSQAGLMADDRQMLKRLRLRTLRAAHAQNNEVLQREQMLPLGVEQFDRDHFIKICGVHNAIDLTRVLNSGVNWIGVHLTYDDANLYEKKVSMSSSSASVALESARSTYRNIDLPIPWAEFRALRQMFQQIIDHGLPVNVVLLVRPKTANEIIRLLEMVVPKKFKQPIYLQIQSSYNEELLFQIKQELIQNGFDRVELIQTVGADEPEATQLILMANNDQNVEMLLIDSNLRGGTGEASNQDRLLELAMLIQKPWFLAGGLSSNNIFELLGLLAKQGLYPLGLDLESSVETDFSLDGVVSGTNIYARVRKDPEKVKQFVNQVNLFEATLRSQEYFQLNKKEKQIWYLLKEAWREVKQFTGYYNIRAIASYVVQKGIQIGVIREDVNIETAVDGIVFAATNYPHLPFIPSEQESVGFGCYESGQAYSWQTNGARELLVSIAKSQIVSRNQFMIFTSGDDEKYLFENYVGTNEQRLRLAEVCRENKLACMFVAHPSKLSIFTESVINHALENHLEIVYADDSIENLRIAQKLARENLINIRLIFVGNSNDSEFEHCSSLASLQEKLVTCTNSLIVLDMDDVLLHEGFRKEHQPKNIYLALKEMGCLNE